MQLAKVLEALADEDAGESALIIRHYAFAHLVASGVRQEMADLAQLTRKVLHRTRPRLLPTGTRMADVLVQR